MSNVHLDAIREAMENAWTGDDEGHVVVMAHAEAMAAALDEAHHRTLEERGLMVCPFCNGTSDSPYDSTTLSLDPPDVCGGCDGHRYINPARLAQHIVTHTDDVWGAFEAAALTEDEQGWL